MRPHRLGDSRLDRVGVADRDHHAAGILGAHSIEAADDASLHLGEALSVRESEPTRKLLDRLPLGQFEEVLQVGAGPVAEVALEEAFIDLHLDAAGLADWCGRFAGPFQRARVNRIDGLQLCDTGGDGLGL